MRERRSHLRLSMRVVGDVYPGAGPQLDSIRIHSRIQDAIASSALPRFFARPISTRTAASPSKRLWRNNRSFSYRAEIRRDH